MGRTPRPLCDAQVARLPSDCPFFQWCPAAKQPPAARKRRPYRPDAKIGRFRLPRPGCPVSRMSSETCADLLSRDRQGAVPDIRGIRERTSETVYFVGVTSTRRFNARLASVVLSATDARARTPAAARVGSVRGFADGYSCCACASLCPRRSWSFHNPATTTRIVTRHPSASPKARCRRASSRRIRLSGRRRLRF